MIPDAFLCVSIQKSRTSGCDQVLIRQERDTLTHLRSEPAESGAAVLPGACVDTETRSSHPSL